MRGAELPEPSSPPTYFEWHVTVSVLGCDIVYIRDHTTLDSVR